MARLNALPKVPQLASSSVQFKPRKSMSRVFALDYLLDQDGNGREQMDLRAG